MKTNVYDPKIESLYQLLGGYVDLEKVSYSLTLEKLKTTGIEFSISGISFKGTSCFIDKKFLKKNITLCELLQTKVNIIDSYTMTRKKTYQISLFYEDVYQLSFKSGDYECDYVLENELGKLTQRIDPATHDLIKSNFFSVLPEKFKQQVEKNGQLTIKVKLVSIGKTRTQCEKNSHIFDTEAEIHSLLKKSSLRYNVKIPKKRKVPQQIKASGQKKIAIKPEYNRLALWGVDTHLDLDGDKVEELFNNFPEFYDFGIKDLIHLRYLVNGMRDDALSNEELLNPSAEVLFLQNKHKEVHHFLINHIPF